MPKPKKKGAGRLAFLDWMRGLAAVVMLQGHAFHAFTKTELRDSGPYMFSQFVGGMPPAVFLFLLGVTLAFLMDSRERAGVAGPARVWASMRRCGYLFLVAFLFRLQLWAFGLPSSPWTDLLKVDILNCMGFAVLVFSVMAFFQTVERVRLCAILGVGIAALSPVVSQLDWSGVPVALKNYIAPDYQSFAFFPWAAFVAFGLSAGSLLRVTDPEQLERPMQWAALTGLGMIVVGQYFGNSGFAMYAKSEYWLDGPWLVIVKQGVILLLLTFAYMWVKYGPSHKWSWVRQFGFTSLLVYWVHIELIYGRWLWFWKEKLSIGQTVSAAVVLIGLMLGLSSLRTNWNKWRVPELATGFYRRLLPARD